MNPKHGQIRLIELLSGSHQITPPKLRTRAETLFKSAGERLILLGITTAEEVMSVEFAKGLDEFAALADIPKTDLRDLTGFLRRVVPKHSVGDFINLKLDSYKTSALSAFGISNEETTSVPVAGEPRVFGALGPSTSPVLVDRRFLPSIRNQWNRETCVAFSACAISEVAEARHRSTSPLDYSEQLLHWECKAADGLPHLQATHPDIAMNIINNNGLVLKGVWSYRKSLALLPGEPPPAVFSPANRLFPATIQQVANPRDVASIRALILEGHAVGVAVTVFGDCFDAPLVVKTGNIRNPFPREAPASGHAMVLVGYSFDPTFSGGGYFIVRNSWGKRWGKNSVFGAGYGSIPFAYIASHNHRAYIARPKSDIESLTQ